MVTTEDSSVFTTPRSLEGDEGGAPEGHVTAGNWSWAVPKMGAVSSDAFGTSPWTSGVRSGVMGLGDEGGGGGGGARIDGGEGAIIQGGGGGGLTPTAALDHDLFTPARDSSDAPLGTGGSLSEIFFSFDASDPPFAPLNGTSPHDLAASLDDDYGLLDLPSSSFSYALGNASFGNASFGNGSFGGDDNGSDYYSDFDLPPELIYRHTFGVGTILCLSYVLVFILGLVGNCFVIAVVFR